MSTQRLTPVDPAAARGKTKELLDFVQQRTGRIPNMVPQLLQARRRGAQDRRSIKFR
jgi:hypothetical protein